jgi:hypothetical protein
MKYKVGDKVRVRSDLEESETYGDQTFVKQMEKYKGKLVTISEEHPRFYYIKEDKDENWCWTDEMFEPVEEMSAIEALEILAEICMKQFTCFRCPIQCIDGQKTCVGIRRENATEVVKVLEQWKADHEKKEIEVELAYVVRVIEDLGYTKKCVYEEDVTEEKEEAMKRVLKEYCKEHDGKFFTVYEEICRVKE